MPNNSLSDFFQSSTELNAIDHFMQLMVKTNSFNQQIEILETRLKKSELQFSKVFNENHSIKELNDRYKLEIEDLNKKFKKTANQKINSQELLYGVWTDSHTGLMWSRISIGQEWRDGASTGNAVEMKWKDADQACKEFSLGSFSNWRLPTIEELKTLMVYYQAGYNCPDNILLRPIANAWGKYFSVTYYGVCFDKGNNETSDDGFSWYVRPVRST